MNDGSFEQIGSAAAHETAESTTTVESPQYVILELTGSNAGIGQGVLHTYMNYVEGAADQAIYATTDGQILYPEYMVGEAGTMYTAAPVQHYSENTTAVTDSQMESNLTHGTTTSQLLAQGNGAYLPKQDFDPNTTLALTATQTSSPQPVTADAGGEYWMVAPENTTINPTSMNCAGHPDLSFTNVTSMATITWLCENFEVAQGASIPCSATYTHYLRHCYENKLVPLNEAAFGKFIRIVFVGLNTRRLGTRGNSKYHYNGIGVKPGSLLNQLLEEKSAVGQQQPPQNRYKLLSVSESCGTGTHKRGNQYEQNPSHSASSNHFNSAPQHHHHQHPGDGSVPTPDFPDIEFPLGSVMPEGLTLRDVVTFRSIYREHCEAFLNAAVSLEFWTVESLWREFWRSQDNNDDECERENYLTKTKLYQLCKFGPVQQFVRRADYRFYQKLLEILIPDVLGSIPSSLTQAILNFANGLQSSTTGVMTNCSEEMTHIKVSALSAFAQALRRYTSLNHLAQAVRPVLQNSSLIDQMLAGLNQIDFRNAEERASWVCQCDCSMQQLEADFKKTLHQQNSLQQWAAWLKDVVTQVLKPYEGKPNFAEAAKQFLLRWSFYNSLVIRDAIFRNAASFGSLYLIRLLCDEYMFFVIEHQVALESGESPIAIMGGENNNNPPNVWPQVSAGGR
jgi:regulatory factor X 1/2/3